MGNEGVAQCRLTVFFEPPFGVGVYERQEGGCYTVSKMTFGAGPKEYEVYAFVLKTWSRWQFSPLLWRPKGGLPGRATPSAGSGRSAASCKAVALVRRPSRPSACSANRTSASARPAAALSAKRRKHAGMPCGSRRKKRSTGGGQPAGFTLLVQKQGGKDCKNSLTRRERGNDTIIFKIGNKTAQGKGCWAATGKGERQNGGQSA